MIKYSRQPKTYNTVLYSKKNFSATITLHRPEGYNALNLEMPQELGDALQRAQWDDDVAVVVISGAGTKAFCTGADIKEWNDDSLNNPDDFYKWMGVFVETMVENLVDKLPDCTRYTKEQLNFWQNFSWAMTVGHAKE